MDIWSGLFFNVDSWSHKDEVIEWTTNTYRYDRKQRCDWAIKLEICHFIALQ